MPSHAVEIKNGLKPGEKVPLCFDECFKIMFGNEKHLEPLTFLLSNILEVGYSEIEGKIALSPLKLPNETIGEKKEKQIQDSIAQDNVNKNPERVKRLMRSYARNQGTQVANTVLANDVMANDGASIDDDTIASYVNALKKIFNAVVEDIRMVFFSGEINEFYDDDWDEFEEDEVSAVIIPFSGTQSKPAA